MSKQLVIVVDYGMGNLSSILNMLRKVGVPAELSRGPEDVLRAAKIILPGVGAFDNAMNKLRGLGYVDALAKSVLIEKVPVLGICLGMQLFSKHSEEGQEPGLAWLDAETVRFHFADAVQGPKVPHMGWNTIRVCYESHFFPNLEVQRRFYFVHSFYVKCNNPGDVLAYTHYGLDFSSAVCHENILGTQFHPEKSHRFGLAFFHAFAAWLPL